MIKVNLYLAENFWNLAQVRPEEMAGEIDKRQKRLIEILEQAILESTGYKSLVTIAEVRPSRGAIMMISDCNLKLKEAVKMLEEVGWAMFFHRGTNITKGEEIEIQMDGKISVNIMM